MESKREILEMWNGIKKKKAAKRVATTNELVVQRPVHHALFKYFMLGIVHCQKYTRRFGS
jgi:hypothetical protein